MWARKQALYLYFQFSHSSPVDECITSVYTQKQKGSLLVFLACLHIINKPKTPRITLKWNFCNNTITILISFLSFLSPSLSLLCGKNLAFKCISHWTHFYLTPECTHTIGSSGIVEHRKNKHRKCHFSCFENVQIGFLALFSLSLSRAQFFHLISRSSLSIIYLPNKNFVIIKEEKKVQRNETFHCTANWTDVLLIQLKSTKYK